MLLNHVSNSIKTASDEIRQQDSKYWVWTEYLVGWRRWSGCLGRYELLMLYKQKSLLRRLDKYSARTVPDKVHHVCQFDWLAGYLMNNIGEALTHTVLSSILGWMLWRGLENDCSMFPSDKWSEGLDDWFAWWGSPSVFVSLELSALQWWNCGWGHWGAGGGDYYSEYLQP